ncbi:hypothetical protein DL95DRAFT_465175 [Leptodontidium sp. 2 PMI_412]|nr:hypothetical protein DL95DRAFT_465175 [Leptodontidium sp. 2 PMI_412]
MGFFSSSQRSDGKSGSSSMNHDKKNKKKKKDSTSPSLLGKAQKTSSSVGESKDAGTSRAETDISKPRVTGEDELRKQVGEEHGQSRRQRSGSTSSSTSSNKPRQDKGKGREETTRSLNPSQVVGPGGSSYHPGLRAQFEVEKLSKRTKPIDEGQTGPVAINRIDATSSSNSSSLSPPAIPNPGGLQVPKEKTGKAKKAAFREKKKSGNKKDNKKDEKKKDSKKKDTKRDDRDTREGDEKKSGGSSGSSAEGSSSRRSGR